MATQDRAEGFGIVPKRRSRRRANARTYLTMLLGIACVSTATAPLSGCMMAGGLGRRVARADFLDEFMVNYRNSAWAARAWLCRRHLFADREFLPDFEAGFRQGYQDVAAGGTGCVPAVCPKAYWGWQYQSADGQRRMNAWFEGYPLGVKAAEEDGIGHWSHVATGFAAPEPCGCPSGAIRVDDLRQQAEPEGAGLGIELLQPPAEAEYLPGSEPVLLPAPQAAMPEPPET